MKKLILLLMLVSSAAFAQEIPAVEFSWNEGDGTVVIPIADIQMFAQVTGRVEVDWTPSVVRVAGPGMRLFDIPNHLGLWMWADGVHGHWYDNAGNVRLFRTRWGLTAPDVQIKVIITWNSVGYAVLVDGVLRIHDWQTSPTTVFPDPDAVNGVYGDSIGGGNSALGSFVLRVYDNPYIYNSCSVDIVGTINQGVPNDNSGAWDQGINPICFLSDATIDLTWILPTENEDGTPLTDIAGINIHQGNTAGGPYPIVYNLPGAPTSYTVENLVDGVEYFFVGTAYNDAGIESVFSIEAGKAANSPASAPDPPTNLNIDTLETIDTVVFTIQKFTNRFILLPVGTVVLGLTCIKEQTINGHYVVAREDVTWTGTIEPQVVVAKCG